MKLCDIVIALGKNWREYPPKDADPSNYKLHLSLESKITALSAADLLLSGLTDRVIISTGKTAGEKWPSEAYAMLEYIKRHRSSYYNDSIKDKITIEEISIDTAGNAEEIGNILIGRHHQKIAVLTTSAHLPRAIKLFRAYGLNVDGIESENYLADVSTHYKNFVKNYRFSSRNITEKLKEKLCLYPLCLLDKKGKFLRLITRRLRGGK